MGNVIFLTLEILFYEEFVRWCRIENYSGL